MTGWQDNCRRTLRAVGWRRHWWERNVPGSGTRELGLRTIALEASYSFPDTARKEAVTVAMSVDGNFYIEKLEAFGN